LGRDQLSHGQSHDPGQSAQRLDRGAAAVAEDASCVGSGRVDRLRAGAGPDVTAAEARSALERRGVRVAELPQLPGKPPGALGPHPEFAGLLPRLGRKLSIELVFGSSLKRGFRVLAGLRLEDGRHLDRAVIDEARRQAPAGAMHDDWSRVLSILAAAAQEPGALDDIALWEVVEVLRPLARLGYSQRALTEQAARLSLERGEAEVLAAAVAEEHELLELLETRDLAAPAVTEPSAPAAYRPTVPDPGIAPGPAAGGPAAGGPAAGGPVTVDPPLQPVTDLQVRTIRSRTDIVQLSWSPPPAGLVSMRMAPDPPPWREGTAVTTGDVDGYGSPLGVTGLPGPDRKMTHELTLPAARAFVTAMTVLGPAAAVGRTVEVTRGAPVRGLSARRFGDEVRLTWAWPEEAIAARVAWQPSAVTGGGVTGVAAGREERTCTRRAYDAEGGFAAVMGYPAQHVAVWVVLAGADEKQVTAPAELVVPGTGIPVHYDVRRVPGFGGLVSLIRRRRRRQVRVRATLACDLPDLVVVESRNPAIPLGPQDGQTVARIAGRRLEPGRPLAVVVPLGPHRPSWVACFVDPARPAQARGQVTLAPAPGTRRQVR
jgi:hypothetical protein